MSDQGATWIVKNEFASVELTIDSEGNDARLVVRDIASGDAVYLDALELSCLTKWSQPELRAIVMHGEYSPDAI